MVGKRNNPSSAVMLWLMLALILTPMVMIVGASFLRKINGTTTWTFLQYIELAQDKTMLMRFGNSLRIACMTMIMQAPVSLLGGLFLNRYRGRMAPMITLAFFVTMLLPFQTFMVPLYQLSRWTGLHDTHEAVALLYAFSPIGPLFVSVLLAGIEEEQWEAALLDTRSLLTIYFQVALPQLLPGLLVFFLLAFSEVWNAVEQPLILLRDPQLTPASLSLNDITFAQTGSTGAAAVVYALPVLLLYGAIAQTLRSAPALGGLKKD